MTSRELTELFKGCEKGIVVCEEKGWPNHVSFSKEIFLDVKKEVDLWAFLKDKIDLRLFIYDDEDKNDEYVLIISNKVGEIEIPISKYEYKMLDNLI